MEAVTQALERLQVEESSVSFKDCSLKLETAEHASVVVEKIRECSGLTSLCLSGNTIGVAAAEAIAGALREKPTLKRALWSDIFTGRLRSEIPKALEALGDAIIASGAKLEELDLSDNAFGPDGVQAVIRLLTSPACVSLSTLKFHNNGLGIGGGKILAKALRDSCASAKENDGRFMLKVLVAGRNRLENDGACALAEAFQELGSLEEIVMFQNGINAEGISALAGAFERNKALKIIDLNDNTFTATGAQAMAKVLPKLEHLHSINFDDCLVRSEGFLALAEALKNGCQKLKELRLSFNEADAGSGEALVRAVLDHSELSLLNINGNEFGSAGVSKLQELAEELGHSDKLGSFSDDEGEDDDDEEDEDGSDGEEKDRASAAASADGDEPRDSNEGQLLSDPGLVVKGVSLSSSPAKEEKGEEKDSRIADQSLADNS